MATSVSVFSDRDELAVKKELSIERWLFGFHDHCVLVEQSAYVTAALRTCSGGATCRGHSGPSHGRSTASYFTRLLDLKGRSGKFYR